LPLLEVWSAGRVMAGPNGNGTVIETRPTPGEIGSAWSDTDRLFYQYDNGKVFSPLWDLFERNIDTMLDRDGKARALEQVLTLPLTWAPKTIEPADGDTGEAAFAREWLLERSANEGGMSTPIELVVAQMSSAVLYRRAFFEKVWKVTDAGELVFDKLAFRPARTCQLIRDDNDWSFQGFRQRFRRGNEYVTRDIKPDKAMVLIHGQHRDPLQGISDLRTAYVCFESKQKVRFLWYQFLENQTIPKAIAQHSNDDASEIQAFAKKVATLKGGGVVGVGQNQSVSKYESSGQGAAVFKAAIEYLDHEMFASCLAGFADLAGAAASGRGSFALSRDQSDFYLRSRAAALQEMGATLTNFAVADLIRWNFGVGARAPTFKFGKLAGQDAESLVTLFQALAVSPTPSPAVPREFLELLTEKVAADFELDVDKVRAAIEANQGGEPGTLNHLATGIDAAARLVHEAGLGQPAAPVAA
jgi:hypothetical protein